MIFGYNDGDTIEFKIANNIKICSIRTEILNADIFYIKILAFNWKSPTLSSFFF